MDLISKTLHYIGKNVTNASVVQIGAMDGINFDDTRGFLDMYGWKSLLVEPIPVLFEELKNNFKDRLNYTFEQCAIAEHDGEIEMLTIPPDVIIKEGLHPGYKGMSAMYPLKNGFGSDYQRDIDVKSKFGVNIKVPSLTFDSLLKKHDIENFDILICDAEGYDWNIFKQLDLNKFRPKFIRLEYINLTDEEKILTQNKLTNNGYIIDIGQDIDAVDSEIYYQIESGDGETFETIQINELTKKVLELEKKYNNLKDELNQTKNLSIKKQNFEVNKNLTIVTGLWNLNRPGRDFSHYIEQFKLFLDIPQNLFIYIPAEYECLVWEKRSKENTYVKIYELDDVKNLYFPFWDKTNEIRKSDNWLNQAGWLSGSPQAVLEYYNPIVQSKMFMLNDATIWNPFNTEYFFWLDAGITNTVPHSHFVENNVLDKLPEYGNPFLFLSYPYEANTEIHGFTFDEMNRIVGKKVEYVCRGGLFGGHKQQIHEANGTYYSVLQTTLNRGFMGTEESIFTLMSYSEPHIYKRFELDGNGLIVKFTQAVIDNKVDIVAPKITELKSYIKYTDRDVDNVKTNLYILTFNFPEQVLHTIESMKKTPEWLTKPRLVLLDNSTIEDSKIKNREIAEQYNFEYIDLGGNRGICGGRQAAAEHFNDSDADFMLFFEDDMTSNPPEFEGQFCRNGFRKYIPNLYNLVHRIMLKEDYDFLKLSFTEVYFDNDKQCSWYNVPQHIRTRDWPNYDKLPISGLDPNVPLTNFKNIKNMDGLTYIDGEIYYANWPMIVSKNGNYKMFIETKWAHPFEQTWMSYIYQLTKENKINPAILLASPIWHDRIKHYQPNERREN
jgi:FkbM family methyltransferase